MNVQERERRACIFEKHFLLVTLFDPLVQHLIDKLTSTLLTNSEDIEGNLETNQYVLQKGLC